MDAETYLRWIWDSLGSTFGHISLEADPAVLVIKHDGRIFHMREAFEPYDILRTSGDVVCEECGDTYRHHPSDMKQLDSEGRPFLRVGCDGRRLKL